MLWPQKKDVLQLKGFIQITSHNVKIMITKCTTTGMQRCQNLSVGKVRLRKQALATDRQLSGVKNGNKYSAAEKALKYWGVEKIKRRGNILEEGEREEHNPKAILPVYASHPSVSPPSLAKNTCWHIRSSN